MILDNALRSLRVILGEAHTTTPVDISVTIQDRAQERSNFQTFLVRSNGTVAVIAAPAPADNTARIVLEVYICNTDTVSHNVIVFIMDGGAAYDQIKLAVPAGKTLQFTQTLGWNTVV